MKTDRERIRFALDFAQMDLDNLREGDWLNLREDMLAFLDWGSRSKDTITPSRLITLREEVKRALTHLAGLFTPRKPSEPGRKILTIGDVDPVELMTKFRERGEQGVAIGALESTRADRIKIDFLYFDVTTRGDVRLLLGAELRESFFLALLTTLSRLDIRYIRQCPSCDRLFYAEHGRQRFCSPRCATRDGTRRFRAKHRQEENERGKANYAKGVRKKLGSKVKIDRRTRTKKP